MGGKSNGEITATALKMDLSREQTDYMTLKVKNQNHKWGEVQNSLENLEFYFDVGARDRFGDVINDNAGVFRDAQTIKMKVNNDATIDFIQTYGEGEPRLDKEQITVAKLDDNTITFPAAKTSVTTPVSLSEEKKDDTNNTIAFADALGDLRRMTSGEDNKESMSTVSENTGRQKVVNVVNAQDLFQGDSQEKDINHLVDQYIHDHDILQQKISQQPLNQFFIEQLTDDLHMTLKVLKYFLKTGHFQVEYKEKKVQDQIHDIAFKGFVDRIDTYDHYVSIIDYKSSAKNIDLNLAMQGFQIQMLIYLDMVTKMTQKDPGAVLYFNTKKRILSVQQNMNKPIEEDEWMKQYRYGGYVIDDGSHQSLLNLDPTFDKRSSLIPVTYVKSKDEYKGQILTIEQLHILFDKISEHIYELYQHMMEGHIEIAPKGSDQKATHTLVNPCFYCPYHSVCSFDVFYNDYQLVEFLDVDSILGGEEDAI